MKHLLPMLLLPIATLLAADPAPLPEYKVSIERLDPAFDKLIPAGATIEKCAQGFNWSEGPAWFQNAIVFSDVPENIIYKWAPGDGLTAAVFMKPSGMLKPTPGFREQGSNGLGVDAQGRLLICQHGERRVARVEKDGTQTSLADKFEGKRFNSPNDLTQTKRGDIYFTDPPYGLDKLNDSPLKELTFNGVFRLAADGKVTAVIKDLTFPQWHRHFPRRKNPLRGSQRSEAYEHHGLRRAARRQRCQWPRILQCRDCQETRPQGWLRWHESGQAGKHLHHRPRRRPSHLPARQTSRHPAHEPADWQLRVGRRWLDPLYLRRHVSLPGKDGDQGQWVVGPKSEYCARGASFRVRCGKETLDFPNNVERV